MLRTFSPNLIRPNFELGKGEKLFQDAERIVIKQVFWESACNQRTIVENTGIPQQTVSRTVKSLMERNILQYLPEQQDGKRRQNLTTNPDFAFAYGISISLDTISVAIINFQGTVLATTLIPLDDLSVTRVLNAAAETLEQQREQCGVPADSILGIGVGLSGFFINEHGKMNTHSKLNAWADINIAEVISQHFQLPTWVTNDASTAAAGEGIAGIGRRYKNFVYFYISSAFGGGLISNNDMLTGTFGNAGELGDMIPPKFYVHPNLELLRQILIKNGVEIDSVYDIIDHYQDNWTGIDEWIFKVKDALSLVATCSSALVDTQAIIIGGDIPKALTQRLIPQIDIYAQNRRGVTRPLPEVMASTIDTSPVAIGAASLPLRELCF